MYDKIVVKSFCSPEDIFLDHREKQVDCKKTKSLAFEGSVVSSLGVFLFHSAGVSCWGRWAKQTYLAEWENPKKRAEVESECEFLAVA